MTADPRRGVLGILLRGDIGKLYVLVPDTVRRRTLGLIALFTVCALLDSLGLVAVFWLFKLIVEPDRLQQVPQISGWLGRLGLTGGDHRVVLAVGLVGLFALKAGLQVLATYLRLTVEARSRSAIAVELLEGYLRRPYGLHLARSGSELSRNLHSAVNTGCVCLLMLLDLAGDLLLLAGVSATLLLLQPWTTLCAIAGGVAFAVAYHFLGQRKFRQWGNSAAQEQQEMYGAVIEALTGVKQIKTLGVERFFIGRYARYVDAYGHTSLKNAAVQQSLKPVLEFVMVAILVLPIAALLLSGASPSGIVPVMAMFAIAAYRLLPSLVRAGMALQTLHFASASIQAVYADVMAFRSTPPVDPAAGQATRFEREIRLDRVSFRYEGRQADALHDVTFSLRRGESIGIVGPSGAGKTTLIDLLLGLLPPSEGRLLIDGVPQHPAAGPRPRLFGYVPQDSFLVNGTIRRNIALGSEAASIDDRRLAAALEAASLAGFVADLPAGLDTEVGDRGVRLSGGQRQRIAIARALYQGSEILVLDEATSSLDPTTEAEVAKAIANLHGRKTLVIVAHRLSTVKHCDRLLLLDGGRLADSGSFAELFGRNALFRQMVHQMGLAEPEEIGASRRSAP